MRLGAGAEAPQGQVPALTGLAGPGPAALGLKAVAERQSLREQITYALRAALISGELRPGIVYSAPTLATEFGVSATPVREAMLDLAKENLVEVVRNKGFRVTEVSPRDLDEYTAIRMLIEVPTVVAAAKAATPEQLAALRPIAQQIVDAAQAGDLIGYIEADRRFHLELLALAGNQRLVEVVGDLRSRARLYGLRELSDKGALVSSAEEHLAIVDALVARDAERVGELMHEHLTHVRSLWAEK